MRTKIAPLMTLGFLLAAVVVIMTCKSKPFDPCPPPEVRPEMPECCESGPDSTKVENKVTVVDTSGYEWKTATYCPCDSTLVVLDRTLWDDEEENHANRSMSPPEGIPIFNFPIPDRLGPEFHDQNRTITDDIPEDARIKVAILDSGLDPELVEEHAHEIAKTMNMFDLTEDVTDNVGHGTAVFAVIDGHAKNLAQYYIYKCIGEDGYATSFSIACALKCARNEGVDIINVSLGSYYHNELIRHIIDRELMSTAIIASRGNDCTIEETRRHFPSNYRHVFGIVGLDADFITPSKKGAPLWGCTNGSRTKVNIAAPSIITPSEGEPVRGTSFAAAFATGRFVVYLFGNRGPNPHVVFRDRYLKDTLAVGHSDAHYMHAAGECVELRIIK